MDGYVSFANIEGLGEPSGLDISNDDDAEGMRKWGRWLKLLPFVGSEGAATPAGAAAETSPTGHSHSLSTGQVEARAY